MGSEHGAVCMPSRAMLLTGRHLWRRGGDNCEGHPLWGETFGAQGYATYVTGKWHNGPAALERAFQQIGPTGGGMLHSTSMGEDGYDRGADRIGVLGGEWLPDDPARAGHWLVVDGEVIHSSNRWAEAAMDWLRAHAADGDERPFFVHLAFHCNNFSTA